jgi:hypothetical protein
MNLNESIIVRTYFIFRIKAEKSNSKIWVMHVISKLNQQQTFVIKQEVKKIM